MMTQAEAKAGILRGYERWPDRPAEPADPDHYMFWLWLRQNRPDLLRFRHRGTQWGKVKTWLIEHDEG